MSKFLKIAAGLLLGAAVARANVVVPPSEPSAARTQKILKDAETYINSLKSISGSFFQRSSNGAVDSGMFYISKPGRMRLEYKSPMLLVADGSSIVYHDKKLDQISYMALDSNPASIILNGNIRLTGENPSAEVKEVREAGGATEITLSLPNEKQTGRMTLIFQSSPFSLEGWRVKDPQGITTSITLSGIRPEDALDASLFKITRGGRFGGTKSKSKYY